MGRIAGGKINYGDSFVVRGDGGRMSDEEIRQARQIAEKIVAEAKERALLIEGQASTKAEEILKQAKEEAQNQAAQITEAAHKEGFEAGIKEGFEKITSEMEERLKNLDNFAASELEMKKRIVKSAHTEILELVTAICEKVCHTELVQNPKLLENLTVAAISKLKEKETVNIIVNPQMAQKIYEISDGLKERFFGLENIKIIEDSSVPADGTIVESVDSRVDSGLKAQISRISDELFNALNSTSEDELVEKTDAPDKI